MNNLDNSSILEQSNNQKTKNKKNKIVIPILIGIIVLMALVIVGLIPSEGNNNSVNNTTESTTIEQTTETNLIDSFTGDWYDESYDISLTVTYSEGKFNIEAHSSQGLYGYVDWKMTANLSENVFSYANGSKIGVAIIAGENNVTTYYTDSKGTFTLDKNRILWANDQDDGPDMQVEELSFVKKGDNTSEATTQQNNETPYETDIYYTVSSDVGLNARKNHSADAEIVTLMPYCSRVYVSEIFVDETAENDDYKYWGLIEANGKQCWVSMKYLAIDDGNSDTNENNQGNSYGEDYYISSNETYLDGDIRNSVSQFLCSAEIEFKRECVSSQVSYSNALKNSDYCYGTKQVFSGTVIDCGQNTFLIKNDDGVIEVSFAEGYNPGIMIDEEVIAYGTLCGTSTYLSTNALGITQDVACPYLDAVYVEANYNHSEYDSNFAVIGSELLWMYGTWYESNLMWAGYSEYDSITIDSTTFSDNSAYSELHDCTYIIQSATKEKSDGHMEYISMEILLIDDTGYEIPVSVDFYYLTNKLIMQYHSWGSGQDTYLYYAKVK